MLPIIYNESEGELINNKLDFILDEKDKRYSFDKEGEVYNFTGFVIEKDKILAVFPKHFFDEEDKTIENYDNIKLLFNVITKYVKDNTSNAKSNKHFGIENHFQSDYPFAAFYRVYEYYKKYGIFREEENEYKKNSKGKISWKKTIQKSNFIISDGNLIFTELYSKNKKMNNDFISECMIFVINHTIEKFPFFIDFPIIKEKGVRFNFIENRSYVLKQLRKYKNKVFKDNNKKLIESLIAFFNEIDKKPEGGPYHFKIGYFELIWQSMVNKYLNDNFVGVDKATREILFDSGEKKVKIRFEFQHNFTIDDENDKKIIPDHFYEDEYNNIFLFDSKYYYEMDGLDYKQIAYTLLIGNSKKRCHKNLYSTLILPGKCKKTDTESEEDFKSDVNIKKHLILNKIYKQLNDGCNVIMEQYIDVKEAMKNYIMHVKR